MTSPVGGVREIDWGCPLPSDSASWRQAIEATRWLLFSIQLLVAAEDFSWPHHGWQLEIGLQRLGISVESLAAARQQEIAGVRRQVTLLREQARGPASTGGHGGHSLSPSDTGGRP